MHVVICVFYFILVKRAAFESWEAGDSGRFGEDIEMVKSWNCTTAKAVESMGLGHLTCGLRSCMPHSLWFPPVHFEMCVRLYQE